MKNLTKLIKEIDLVLVENRESLSDLERKVLIDCKELAKLCQNTEDPNLKQMLLIDLTLKVTAFLTNGSNIAFIKKLDNSLLS